MREGDVSSLLQLADEADRRCQVVYTYIHVCIRINTCKYICANRRAWLRGGLRNSLPHQGPVTGQLLYLILQTSHGRPRIALILHFFSFFIYLLQGPFLGCVEIAWAQMVAPPPGEFDYPLKTKAGLAAKRQAKVGGSLTLEYSLDMRPAAASAASSSAASAGAVELLQVPRSLWLMKAPALSLTVASAVNLASANAFGGGSDPFVVVYLVPPPAAGAAAGAGAGAGAGGPSAKAKASPETDGAAAGAAAASSSGGMGGDGGAAEPLFKTRVIDGSLNPIWNETFLVPLHVTMVSLSSHCACARAPSTLTRLRCRPTVLSNYLLNPICILPSPFPSNSTAGCRLDDGGRLPDAAPRGLRPQQVPPCAPVCPNSALSTSSDLSTTLPASPPRLSPLKLFITLTPPAETLTLPSDSARASCWAPASCRRRSTFRPSRRTCRCGRCRGSRPSRTDTCRAS